METAVLVRRAAGGDMDSYEALVRLYQGVIFRMVYYRVLSRMDAEDITQDVFLQAMKSVKNLRDPERFNAWLYRIALNRIRDFLRKKKLLNLFRVESGRVGEEGDIPVAERIGDLERKDFWRHMNEFLADLSHREREVFRLRFLDHLGIREIAEVIQKNESTVKTCLYRSVKKFKDAHELQDVLDGIRRKS
ncbi:MAG: RNA polymerase sigma factor [Desulfomonilia bacterium]